MTGEFRILVIHHDRTRHWIDTDRDKLMDEDFYGSLVTGKRDMWFVQHNNRTGTRRRHSKLMGNDLWTMF